MSRYCHDFPTNKDSKQIGKITDTYLISEGFRYTSYNGEQVWQKGDGIMVAPQFIKVMTMPGFARVEAWIKFSVFPGVFVNEMDLEGAVGIAVKKFLKDRVRTLEYRLIHPD